MTGRIIASKLRLDEHLASGAMGEVWRARHLGLDKDVAVKFLRADRVPTQDLTLRFIREARTACRLNHPNSIAILDFGQDESGALYLAMELAQGPTLAELLADRGALPPLEGAAVLMQVLAAVGAAHDEGILHRDIKPSNIMLVPALDDDGRPTTRVKVCDFGLAKFSRAHDTLEGSERRLVGTPLYMSPEQATGETLDERTDLYACGVVLFETMTGRPPFEADRAVSVLMKHCASPVPKATDMCPDLPPGLDAVIAKALAKESKDRYPTARAFRSDLARAVPDVSKQAPTSGTHYFVLGPTDSGSFISAEPVPITADLPMEAPVEAPASGTHDDMTLDLRLESVPESQDDLAALLPTMRLPTPRQPITNDARFLWERYALSPHRPNPPRGFWLLDAKSNRVGPLTFDELSVALRLEAHDGAIARCLVSADPKPDGWHPAVELLRLLRSEAVSELRAPPATSAATYRGRIDATAIPALLLRCSESEMTGRVVLARSDSARPVFFEAHAIAGHPTYVATNDLKLQLPAILVAKGVIDEHELPHLVSYAWEEGTDFETAARSLAGVEIQEVMAGVMRRRLRGMLRMGGGAWVLDSSFEPEPRRPFAASFAALLPRLVTEALEPEAVEQALEPHLDRALGQLPDIDETVDLLGFTSSERTIARELMSAPRLGGALPSSPELRRTYSSVAYLLISSSSSLAPED